MPVIRPITRKSTRKVEAKRLSPFVLEQMRTRSAEKKETEKIKEFKKIIKELGTTSFENEKRLDKHERRVNGPFNDPKFHVPAGKPVNKNNKRR